MSLYTKESIDRAKEAVDMAELVGARTDLRRVGTRLTGLCPFHEERTPSFSVNVEHGLYHCFGCDASGDAIRFVQETEALDFREAVELLADRYGVELQREQEDPRAEERRRRRERLLELVERATSFYERFLWDAAEAAPAREYLAERGLGEEVLRRFRVGCSPSAPDRLVKGARAFSDAELVAAGLARRGSGGPGLADRFRGRIMFPLADARGRVLGFGARALGENGGPKYLNTSENELYHKGRQLFGIDNARAAAAKAGRIVVVEGYTDVLALQQAGLTETVAIMGTALTQEQLAELSRAASSIHLALDADRSGQEAMLRAARGAEERGVELRVVALPEGADPAELVGAEGLDGFTRRLAASMSVPEFQVHRVLAGADLRSTRGRDLALEAVRPLIGATPARSAIRQELVRFASDRLDVPAEFVETGATPRQRAGSSGARSDGTRQGEGFEGQVAHSGTARHGAAGGGGHSGRAAATPSDAAAAAERAFLAMCLSQGSRGRAGLERLTDEQLSSPALRDARDHLREHFEDPLATLPEDDPVVGAVVTEVTMRAETEPSSEPALELSYLQLELRRIARELRRAVDAEDHEVQRGLWSAREAVRAEIEELMGQAV